MLQYCCAQLANQEHTQLQRNLATTYPINDRIPYELAVRLGLTRDERAHGFSSLSRGSPYCRFRARWTGETRPPKRGEWFLSGAIIGAYRACSDMITPYPISSFVRVRVETVEVTEEVFHLDPSEVQGD